METINDLLTIGGVQVSPAEVIKRYRLNLMIHSHLYYWGDDPLWTDDKWQQVANDLVTLQEMFPEPIGFYDEDFKDWTGATGMHLTRDSYIIALADDVYRTARHRLRKSYD